jgi:Leucine-rich repeat (LRR) protein
MVKLQSIDMINNELDGPIPVEIGNLTDLNYLDVAGNNLTGTIPPALGSLTKLTYLSMYENEIEGTIPPDLGNLTELQTLYLTSNRLTGTIPDLRNLKKLVSFYLGGNQLTGPIPDWIGELTALQTIYFPGNRLTGVIPPSIGNLSQLDSLYLGDNRLTGSIPREIGNLHELGYLQLEYTDISGPIPPEFWSLTNLVEVRINNMDLSGMLPAAVGNLTRVEVFLLGNNHLEGPLPPELGNLSSVLYLGLGANRFTGSIPADLGRLTQLLGLDLANNALRGDVPASLRALTNLSDGQNDFTFNAIFASDPATREFLGRKQWDPDLHGTQTLTPAGLRVTQTTDRSATLEWDLITYSFNDGGYQVIASTTPGGPPAVVATTTGKDISSITVRGLQPTTTYHFTVAAVTHPHDLQQNLLTSDPSAPVSTTTAARVIAPPDVAVTEHTTGLVQIDGTPRNEDSFTLTNFGDTATSITFFKEGGFFTLNPETFVLAGGGSQTVRVTSISQPPGTHYGYVAAEGEGTGADDTIGITLLSTARPSGTVIAEALEPRIEVVGQAGDDDDVGTARFRNVGTARLSGIVLSDQPWIVPRPDPITIDPGTIGTVNFSVLRSRRPPGVDGALTANLALVYVDGSLGFETLQTGGTGGISTTLVTIVDITRPSTNQSVIPGFGAGEVGLFAPGVGRSVADLSLSNTSGSRAINDVRLYFLPANGSQSTVATLSSLGSTQSVSLANVVSSVYSPDAGPGSLQIRSASWQSLAAQVKFVNVKPNGTFAGDIPLLRSDRSATSGQEIYLTGVRKSASLHTDLYLQETSGAPASVRIDMLDASGGAVGPPINTTVPAFGIRELLDAVPAAAMTAIATVSEGRVAAYARVSDDASGDTWSIVDWSRVQRFTLTEAVRVPFMDSTGGAAPRRRRAIRVNSDANEVRPITELTLFNPTTAESRATIRVAGAQEREVVIGARRTITVSDAAAATPSHAVVTPSRGQVVVSARTYRSLGGTWGAALPVLPAVAGLRLGQTQRFSNLEDSTAKTVAAATPGTFRTSFGLVETSGAPVTVRASMLLDIGRSLVSAVVRRDFTLAANQHVINADLVKAIIGDARETELGELHNLQLQLEVISGSGSVVPFVIITDNGSGDSIVRVE